MAKATRCTGISIPWASRVLSKAIMTAQRSPVFEKRIHYCQPVRSLRRPARLRGGCPYVASQAARAAGSGAGTVVGGW